MHLKTYEDCLHSVTTKTATNSETIASAQRGGATTIWRIYVMFILRSKQMQPAAHYATRVCALDILAGGSRKKTHRHTNTLTCCHILIYRHADS